MEKLKIKCLISGDQTQSKVAVFEEKVAPMAGPPLHLHKNQHEIFHVIKGSIRFQVEDQVIDVEAGASVLIPPGKPHGFRNRNEHDALIHFELLPAGESEAFFEKLCAGDFENPHELFADHGLELLGPPIETES